MSILFDKWKELTDLEKAQEEEQYLIQEEEEISKRNSKILRGGKFNTFEEMKAAVSGEAVNEEIVEKRHTSWMDAIRKLKKDMKEMENNPLGKIQAEVEALCENEKLLKKEGGMRVPYKDLIATTKISTADRIKQLQVEIGCLEDEIWTLKLLQLEEAKANENNVETPNPQY